ncbi:hypothetical protein HX088_11205 [Empedobacter sp. 225-1]|uniref:hypothetical protein n=1 Tax=Empedobacter sp. 225-1 TaxID=2746725 RepID=UPI00257880FE|nr:hypothetical protein [Empedobacter sp. 225-1]MDM1523833.1 hypothetical protein [Empedobacter sp. 225-1]
MNKEPQQKKKQNNGRTGKVHTPETKEKISNSMIGNLNAEKYDEDEAIKIFSEAIKIAKENKLDFIGEVANEQGIYLDIYDDLIQRFQHLKILHKKLKRTCEANCFTNAKKGKIHAGVAIMNLKSNHQWTDRMENKTDITSGGMPFKISDMLEFDEDEED